MNAPTQKILRWRLLGITLLALFCLLAMQMSVSVVVAQAQVQADAGPLQTVLAGDTVMLFGGNSTGTIATYSWAQVAGPPVNLLDDSSDPPDPGIRYFTAPTPSDANGACLVFELSVSNGVTTSSDTCIVNVTIDNGNQPPIAHAGYDQDIYFDFMDPQPATIELNGNQSLDPDNDALSYQWTQVGGATVALNDSNSMTANLVHSGSCGNYEKVYIFELLVTDSNGLKDESTTVVMVHPPGCPVPQGQGSATTSYSPIEIDYITDALPVLDPSGEPIADAYIAEANSTFDLDAQASYVRTTCGDLGCFDTTVPVTDVRIRQVRGKAAKTRKVGGSLSNIEATAPEVVSDAETLTFAVQAFDEWGRLARTTLSIDVILSSNSPPTAEAGLNVTISSEDQWDTVIQGSADDLDGDVLTYRWVEGDTELSGWDDVDVSGQVFLDLSSLSHLSVGQHTLTLEVKDAKATSSDDMILTIGNSAPNAAPAGGGVFQIFTSVILGGDVSDFDGDELVYEWREGDQLLFSGSAAAIHGGSPVTLSEQIVNDFDLGIHTLTLSVSDGVNEAVSSDITVVVIDTTAPVLAPLTDNTILWPPNHKMVDVTIWANASDNSGGPVTLFATVVSNESVEGLGDGDESPDWSVPLIDQENGVITLQLRAERSGSGDGRVYSINITATDESGISSYAIVETIVPHDKAKK